MNLSLLKLFVLTGLCAVVAQAQVVIAPGGGTVGGAGSGIVIRPAGTVTGPVRPIRLRPDLTVSNFQVVGAPTLHCGSQSVTFTYTESNIGNAPMPSHWNRYFKDGYALIGKQHGPLGAGQSRTITETVNFYNGPCDCFPTTYTTSWYICVDFPDYTVESNEGNNCSNTVVIGAACP